ncbi:MAG TPA: hypothetical protein DC013_11375 [Ruminococcaceae bacterium]|jgi:hypothetical protein|nr:hypothetical protein [Oscillospiraceae bacterium]
MFHKKSKYWGFLGFLGFLAFRLIGSGNLYDLTYVGFFGFFSYFFIGKISGNRTDERYAEDDTRARAFMGNLALIEIMLMMILGVSVSAIREYLPVLVSACFASLLIAYAVKFYLLEER